MKPLKITAISGSLKSTSANSTILKTLSAFKRDAVQFNIYNGLEDIPAFNPDKEQGNAAVAEFKRQLKEADGVIISTPEYAFGVPGVLKNALDWTVSSGELNEKPVIAISASPMYAGGDKAMTSLLLTLGALGTKMTEHSSLSIANVLNKLKDGAVSDQATLDQLHALFDHLINTIAAEQ